MRGRPAEPLALPVLEQEGSKQGGGCSGKFPEAREVEPEGVESMDGREEGRAGGEQWEQRQGGSTLVHSLVQ